MGILMKYNKNRVILFAIILIFVLLQLPLISNPYHYDAIAWVSQSKYLLENGPFARPPQDFGHPYFMFWTLALIYKIFGENVIASHLVMLIFSIITIVMTYLIGKELFNEKTALVASAFLSFQPWFFTVTNWVYFDIPLTSLFAISMYLFIRAIKTEKKKYYWLFALFGSMAALTKAPGTLVSLIPLVYFVLKKEYKPKYLVFLIPILATMLWMLWHYIIAGYFYDSKVEGGVLLPISMKNIFLIGKTYTTNIFFNFTQNGNFIAFLIITYALFFKKYEKLYLILVVIFLILGHYSFRLAEPDMKFYPLLLLLDIIFFYWIFQIPKLKDEYKLLLIWIAAVMLHSFYTQISFRYGLPMLPAFAILFGVSVQKIKHQNIILLLLFGIFLLQIYNYSNYYAHRDIIYTGVFDYLENRTTESVMVFYPLATPDLVAVKEIDSRPWGETRVFLIPENKSEFERLNPQYLVLDERSIPFTYQYIQEIVKTEVPEVTLTEEIKWYTYYGVRDVFVNRLYIYKFY